MLRLQTEVSIFDGHATHQPGVIDIGDYELARRVVAHGHGAVLVGEGEAATPATLEQTLEALKVKPDTDGAAAIARGLERLAKAHARAAAKASAADA